MSGISFSKNQLLWWTRGRNWDREIVTLPTIVSSSNWNGLFSKLFSKTAKATEDGIEAGQIHCANGMAYFIATSFESNQARDWTNRPIPHYLVLFDLTSKSDIEFRLAWDGLPGAWAQAIEQKFLLPFYESSVFSLSDDEVRYWRKEHPEPFYLHAQETFSQFLPSSIEVSRTPNQQFPVNISAVLFEDISIVSKCSVSGEFDLSQNSQLTEISKPTLAEEINELILTTCKEIAQKCQKEFMHREENIKRIICLLVMAFNGNESDSFVKSWAEQTINMQSIIGVPQWAGKKILSKIPGVKKYFNSPELIGVGLEKCARCLSRSDEFNSLSFESEEEGMAYISRLLPGSRTSDIVVKALLFRTERLIQEAKKRGITSA